MPRRVIIFEPGVSDKDKKALDALPFDKVYLFKNGEARPSVWDTGHLIERISQRLEAAQFDRELDAILFGQNFIANLALCSVVASEGTFCAYAWEWRKEAYLPRQLGKIKRRHLDDGNTPQVQQYAPVKPHN